MGAQGEGKFYSPYPHYITRAKGARVWDADGTEYIDYWNGAGPCVLGHGHEPITRAVMTTIARRGVLYSATNDLEIELCEALADIIPCAHKSAFLNAGSDVLCLAARASRALTERQLIVKFAGSYHGWYDGLLFNISSYDGAPDNTGQYRPIAESSGLPAHTASLIRVLEYNDIAAVESLFAREGNAIAAIFVEPIMHGAVAGCITPKPGFLERIRELCTEYGVVLVYDEILTGFRHDLGGAQKRLGVIPDLAAFGKGIANGFPIAALCGTEDFMGQLSPDGRAYFSGTYNGNVISVAAALATIEELRSGEVLRRIEALGTRLRNGMNEIFRRRGVTAIAVSYGPFVAVHFASHAFESFGDANRSHDFARSRDLVSHLFSHGVYTKPRKVLRFGVSGAHGEAEIDRTLEEVDGCYRH
jgi:glutamate-1-semialdehyde 2,1-aminomutase